MQNRSYASAVDAIKMKSCDKQPSSLTKKDSTVYNLIRQDQMIIQPSRNTVRR